jgi:hypothetical protein
LFGCGNSSQKVLMEESAKIKKPFAARNRPPTQSFIPNKQFQNYPLKIKIDLYNFLIKKRKKLFILIKI